MVLKTLKLRSRRPAKFDEVDDRDSMLLFDSSVMTAVITILGIDLPEEPELGICMDFELMLSDSVTQPE